MVNHKQKVLIHFLPLGQLVHIIKNGLFDFLYISKHIRFRRNSDHKDMMAKLRLGKYLPEGQNSFLNLLLALQQINLIQDDYQLVHK